MEMALGMSESEANGIGWRGTDQGTKMKATYGWNNVGNGNNSSGLSGLPGGHRIFDGNFMEAGSLGLWWSSSPDGSDAWGRALGSVFGPEWVLRQAFNLRLGHSVRCVRDSE